MPERVAWVAVSRLPVSDGRLCVPDRDDL